MCVKIAAAVSRSGGVPLSERDIAFGDRVAHRIGRRHDSGLGDRRMLDQHAFKLERAQTIVARFEHVVGAADEGDVAVGVARGDVAGLVIFALDGNKFARSF